MTHKATVERDLPPEPQSWTVVLTRTGLCAQRMLDGWYYAGARHPLTWEDLVNDGWPLTLIHNGSLKDGRVR